MYKGVPLLYENKREKKKEFFLSPGIEFEVEIEKFDENTNEENYFI
jgi:hypothetical protein